MPDGERACLMLWATGDLKSSGFSTEKVKVEAKHVARTSHNRCPRHHGVPRPDCGVAVAIAIGITLPVSDTMTVPVRVGAFNLVRRGGVDGVMRVCVGIRVGVVRVGVAMGVGVFCGK